LVGNKSLLLERYIPVPDRLAQLASALRANEALVADLQAQELARAPLWQKGSETHRHHASRLAVRPKAKLQARSRLAHCRPRPCGNVT